MGQEAQSDLTNVTAGDNSNSLMNVLLGAVVTVVTSPLLPYAAIVGGGIAGYLQRGTLREGATVGAMSGAITAVPATIVGWFLISFFLGLAPASLFALVLSVVVGIYLIGTGALGGALGAYLQTGL